MHTSPVLASYVVAPLLSEFRQRHPGIVVELQVEAYRDPPIEDFDITLLGADAAFDASIVARKIVESDVILVVSPAYDQRTVAPQTPARSEVRRVGKEWVGTRRASWYQY